MTLSEGVAIAVIVILLGYGLGYALGTALAEEKIVETPSSLLKYIATNSCNSVGGKLHKPNLCETVQDISYFVTDSTADILLCANTLLSMNTWKGKHCFILGTAENEERTARLAKSLSTQGIYVYLMQKRNED